MTEFRQPGRQCVLLIDDDQEFLEEARRALRSHDIAADLLQDSSRALQTLAAKEYAVVCLDWVMPGQSGADLLPDIVRYHPGIPVIIMSGVSDLENVVNCIKQGAYDYITKPLDASRLVSVVQKAFTAGELANQNRKLTGYLMGEPLANPDCFSEIITRNERMQGIFKIIEALSPSKQPMLITGETGVGKELIARAIHKASGLSGKLVTLNAAGMGEAMLEDTLFGHKRGAFTSATEGREGLIEQAKGGTLFLDEIGDLSKASQVKLLRLIQQNEYYRLGSDILLKSNARIITASNVDFKALLASGAFREDLYHRISAHNLHIPPLRERCEDILPLAKHFITITARTLKMLPPLLSAEVRQALASYHFPGNIRQLMNMVNDAVANNRSGTLEMPDFPRLPPACNNISLVSRTSGNQFVLYGIFPEFPTMEEVERLLVKEALREAGGRRKGAAELLQVSRPTIRRRAIRLEEQRATDMD